MSDNDYLKLDNQVCFPLYAASRKVTKLYQPLLSTIDVTYPQYLVLLLLWEAEQLSVTEIGERLLLETNTLTPLLKRMEVKGIIKRTKSKRDERVIEVTLTNKGITLQDVAATIPVALLEKVSDKFPIERVLKLRDALKEFLAAIY